MSANPCVGAPIFPAVGSAPKIRGASPPQSSLAMMSLSLLLCACVAAPRGVNALHQWVCALGVSKHYEALQAAGRNGVLLWPDPCLAPDLSLITDGHWAYSLWKQATAACGNLCISHTSRDRVRYVSSDRAASTQPERRIHQHTLCSAKLIPLEQIHSGAPASSCVRRRAVPAVSALCRWRLQNPSSAGWRTLTMRA